MKEDKPTKEQALAAEKALRWVYPDLKFTRSQITLDAAVFAFEVMRRVNVGARAAYGLLKLYNIGPTKWSDIPKAIIKAVLAATRDPKKPVRSRIALAFIALQFQRLIQAHLQDPETFPCPQFAGTLFDLGD